MAPRELSRVAFNLASWIAAYVSRLLVKLELPIYCAFCMYIYSSFLRGALPGRYDDIFFWIVLIQGVSSGHSGVFSSPLIRKLLSVIVEAMSANLK